MSVPLPRRIAPALFLTLGMALCQPCSGSNTSSAPKSLRQIAASLSQRWKLRVLIDPALASSALPALPDPGLTIEQALDAVLTPLRHVAWRRLYLPPGPGDPLPAAGALATAVRSLELPEPGSVVFEDPTRQQVMGCLKNLRSASSLDSMLRAFRLAPTPIYLVFRTLPAALVPAPQQLVVDLQRQQLSLPLPPERQALAMAQMARLVQALPPADAEAFASRTLAAGTQLWDSTPANEREAMIQQSLQLMQAFGAPPRSPGAAGPSGTPPVVSSPPPSRVPPADRPSRSASEGVGVPRSGVPGDTRALGAALTGRYGASFLVDPSLFFLAPAALPDADLPAEKALAAMADLLPGAAGRRVYLRDVRPKRLPVPDRLAAAAREMDELAPSSLLVENVAAGRAALYLKDQPKALLPQLIEQGRLGDSPLYLLYSTTPAARGGSLEERVADLQRQQLGMLLRMSAQEMGDVVAAVIQEFSSADPETQARLMGLPAMAGLMAVWLPREAKERGQPLAPYAWQGD